MITHRVDPGNKGICLLSYYSCIRTSPVPLQSAAKSLILQAPALFDPALNLIWISDNLVRPTLPPKRNSDETHLLLPKLWTEVESLTMHHHSYPTTLHTTTSPLLVRAIGLRLTGHLTTQPPSQRLLMWQPPIQQKIVSRLMSKPLYNTNQYPF